MCYPYLCANGNQCGTGPRDMLGTKFIAKATDAELASSKFESFFDHTHEMAHVSQKIEDVAASVEEFVEELIGTPCLTGSACNGDPCGEMTMNGVISCCYRSSSGSCGMSVINMVCMCT
ncbi:hypothetical protein ScalyP_jg10406 [Parmales sp. scaly parma]|nr:hypothetical protein ScalyP_jg10406 [Parmales sp. scaly parma]